MASQAALTLISGAKLVPLGPESNPPEHAAILIGGSKILGLLAPQVAAALVGALPSAMLATLDAMGLLAVPGFIDMHVHVCGGGGEAGAASRTPEAELSELLRAGITTCVGITGTDSVSRSQENLVTKTRALNEDGITAYHWCGSYGLPPATVTGSVQRELCLMATCIGVGEVAVSDHRGSAPTPQDLLRLGLEARVGGMLGGKAGIVHCHLGPGAARLQPLRDALALGAGDLSITVFHPTPMDRSPELINEGAAWLADGGTLDLTCSSPECCTALHRYHEQGLPLGSITVSTDSYGSLPVFDEQGRLVQYDVADPGAMLRFLRSMVMEEGWELEQVLPLMTCNPATRLRLNHIKGRIAVGCDADILLLEPDTLALQYVLARGELLKTPEWVRGGMFERDPGIRPRKPPIQTAG